GSRNMDHRHVAQYVLFSVACRAAYHSKSNEACKGPIPSRAAIKPSAEIEHYRFSNCHSEITGKVENVQQQSDTLALRSTRPGSGPPDREGAGGSAAPRDLKAAERVR